MARRSGKRQIMLNGKAVERTDENLAAADKLVAEEAATQRAADEKLKKEKAKAAADKKAAKAKKLADEQTNASGE